MVPPHESPTCQAASSATPSSGALGLRLSITSSASVTTAPSTQPPETLPRKLPWSSITRLEPTGRGAEPQVSTTVASATPRPALRQSSAALRMSSSRARVSIRRSIGRREYMSCDLGEPCLRVARPRVGCRERTHEIGHRLQIVDRAQFVNVGQHGADAFCPRLEAGEAQQRIEPDESSAGAVQPVDLERELIAAVAFEAVGDQKHDRSLREYAARPQLVESSQRGRDAGAAGPVL